jgi:hypothetical protein
MDDAEELDARYHRGIHSEIAKEVVRLTPVDEGDMKRGWGTVIGGPEFGGSAIPVGTGLSRIKAGSKSKVVNSDRKSHIIDQGRRLSAAGGKRPPFPIGSKRRPRGVTKPALTAVESRADQIRAKVIARVERG